MVAGARGPCGRETAFAHSEMAGSAGGRRSSGQDDDGGSRGLECKGKERAWMAAGSCIVAGGVRELDSKYALKPSHERNSAIPWRGFDSGMVKVPWVIESSLRASAWQIPSARSGRSCLTPHGGTLATLCNSGPKLSARYVSRRLPG